MDTSYYERACLHFLDSRGVDLENVLGKQYETDRERWQAWLAESIHAGFIAFRKGDRRVALRCALQACEHVGRSGGYWPSPALSDAYLALRNLLEDALS